MGSTQLSPRIMVPASPASSIRVTRTDTCPACTGTRNGASTATMARSRPAAVQRTPTTSACAAVLGPERPRPLSVPLRHPRRKRLILSLYAFATRTRTACGRSSFGKVATSGPRIRAQRPAKLVATVSTPPAAPAAQHVVMDVHSWPVTAAGLPTVVATMQTRHGNLLMASGTHRSWPVKRDCAHSITELPASESEGRHRSSRNVCDGRCWQQWLLVASLFRRLLQAQRALGRPVHTHVQDLCIRHPRQGRRTQEVLLVVG